MTKNQQEAIERACGHENLLADVTKALESLIVTSTLVKFQADNSGKTPYSDWSSAVEDLKKCQASAREVLARATSQDVK